MILEIREATFSYQRKKDRILALDRFFFSVKPHERVALLGDSGSGKSTVLKLASGILCVNSGSVRLNNLELKEMSATQRAALRLDIIGQIFQDFRLFPELTAEQNVAFTLQLRGVHKREALLQAKAALTSVGMENRLKHRPSELSGGEQQRVGIARAFAVKPKLVLADEPTGSLDADRRDDILDLAFDMLPDAAFVLVTHDPVVAERATRVVRMPSPESRHAGR